MYDCIGVIDGTYAHAYIPVNEQIPYRRGKIQITQNIMYVCSFDMRFTYFMTRWEATANDAQVLMKTIKNLKISSLHLMVSFLLI